MNNPNATNNPNSGGSTDMYLLPMDWITAMYRPTDRPTNFKLSLSPALSPPHSTLRHREVQSPLARLENGLLESSFHVLYWYWTCLASAARSSDVRQGVARDALILLALRYRSYSAVVCLRLSSVTYNQTVIRLCTKESQTQGIIHKSLLRLYCRTAHWRPQ